MKITFDAKKNAYKLVGIVEGKLFVDFYKTRAQAEYVRGLITR